jgi:hypothetical protein
VFAGVAVAVLLLCGVVKDCNASVAAASLRPPHSFVAVLARALPPPQRLSVSTLKVLVPTTVDRAKAAVSLSVSRRATHVRLKPVRN